MRFHDMYEPDLCDMPTATKNIKQEFKEPLELSELDKIHLQKAEEKRRRKAERRLNNEN